MKKRSFRLWLILLGAIALGALAVPLARAVAQTDAPLIECPPNCMVTFDMPSIFQPASGETAEIRALFTFILVAAGIVFVLVEGMLFFTVWRFRNRPPEAAVQVHGNTKLEIAWTAAPAVILAVLLGFTLRTMAIVRAVPGEENVVRVTAIGHQWWWEFRYPELGIVTANEMVVPVGATVEVQVESVDVVHSFWAPELFGKVDAVPGYTNRIRFVPTEVRTDYYAGQCAEFCGIQHAAMRFGVVVRSPEDFDTWARLMQAEPVAELSGDAAAGRDLFLLPTINGQPGCMSCHTVQGTAAVGQVGPNLTHLARRAFIAGGMLKTTPEDLYAWIMDPQAIKPGALMPTLGLTDEQADQLVAYLTQLK